MHRHIHTRRAAAGQFFQPSNLSHFPGFANMFYLSFWVSEGSGGRTGR